MADGKIVFSTKIDNSQIDKDLKALERKIRQSEESIHKSENAKLPLVKQAEDLGARLDEAKAKLAELESKRDGITNALSGGSAPEDYSSAFFQRAEVDASLKGQNKEVTVLQKKWDAVNDKIDAYDLKIKQAQEDIAANTAEAGRLEAQLYSGGAKMADAFNKARDAATRFVHRIIALGKRILVFSLIASAFRSIKEYMDKALRTNEEYTAQLAKLKGALLTAFQPIYEFILPGLLAVMRMLTAIVQVVANVLSALSGKTAAQSAKNAKALNDEADAINAVSGAAKNAGKNLANFDEINQLGGPETSGGGGGSAAGVTADFTDFSTDTYKEKIDELTVYMSGALLGLGAILAFSGANIPLGIGLMAAGAIGLASVVKVNWKSMSKNLQGAIGTVATVLGGAALVLGAILAFSGVKRGLGIALLAIGAASLATASAMDWNNVVNTLQGPIGQVVAIVSASLLALGAILSFSGANISLGIGLLAVGASGLAATATVNWNSIESALRGPTGKVVALVSGVLLALGAILAFSGANIPLGVALLAVGAIGLVTVSALNWNAVETALRGPVGKVAALASGVLLVLGLILAFSGINLPLGIALIAAGAAGLISVTAINWNAVQEELTNAWQGIKQWFNTNVAPKLTLSYWKEKFSNIATGLVQKIKDGVNSGIALFNKFISWVNSKMRLSWGDFSVLGKKVISAGSFQLLRLPSIPYLAQGAVLPANKPFLAMVGDQKNGTNIEAPLETIKQALAEVMAMQGTGDINITFTGDLAQLARVLKPVIEKEGRRTGGSLAKETFT